jgi:hypothetical protein
MKKLLDMIPWIGMAMLQFNAVPAIFTALEEGSSTPIATVLLTLGGLTCYMYRAIIDKSALYLVGNTIGITGNLILLWCII